MSRSRELRGLAVRAANEVSSEPFIEATLLTGSVARGDADAHSDIDLIFYLGGPAPETFFDAQRAEAEASGGGFFGGTAEGGFGVFRFIEGVKVDFGFNRSSEIDEFVTAVIDDSDLELVKQQVIAGIRDGEALHGAERIQAWRDRTDEYPADLRDAMVRAHMNFTPPWVARAMGADRRDRLFVADLLVENAKRFLSVLYALNGVFHPNKFKGAGAALDRLRIAPSGLGRRLYWMLAAPLPDAADEYENLATEVLALIAEHASHLDVDAARKRLAWTGAR